MAGPFYFFYLPVNYFLVVAVESVVVVVVVVPAAVSAVVVTAVVTEVESAETVLVSSFGLLLQAERITTEVTTNAKNTFFILFSFLVLVNKLTRKYNFLNQVIANFIKNIFNPCG